ncbi:nitrogenase iron-molybdenum cofactor biosynthesis protein NifN [Limisalsivibrio acetivorans]|uniref:nitrogenase iron-molybdenum cofactor biosynthesis protein NifN n=1 Tax=Limisalsivibrio acetivorans TaxID=1304888 RepID=UPI00040C2253|nr:nitrogenase iron-molybdenum cofactor biosynthesis protein NifN [Limisalsivibrio acetivorans]
MKNMSKTKPGLINPLKKSRILGSTLVFLGIDRSMPMHHGSQGCTAFAKNLFTQHFREIVPMQTTALTDIATIIGEDTNLFEGIINVAEKHSPSMIGLMTTGITETRGDDLKGSIKMFRNKHPKWNELPIVPVRCPDFEGDAEAGYADAAADVIETVTQIGSSIKPSKVNLFPGMSLTAGDIDEITEMLEDFGLAVTVFPDLSRSVAGATGHFYSVPEGGTSLEEIRKLSESTVTIAVGEEMRRPAEKLKELYGVDYKLFPSLVGIRNTDTFLLYLKELTDADVPEKYSLRRARLQDAMLDAHFYCGGRYFSAGLEASALYCYVDFLTKEMGMKCECAVSPAQSSVMESLDAEELLVGDLEDLQVNCSKSDIVIGNSALTHFCGEKGIAHYKAGFPVKDQLGHHLRSTAGYRGTMSLVFSIGNIMLEREENKMFAKKEAVI